MSCAIKLLPYCILHNSLYEVQAEGVRGAPLKSIPVDTLTCLYSLLIPPQEFNQDDALSFHWVLNAAFQQQAIIPFRFPTILQNETELQTHVREKAAAYSDDLRRLADMVQMELRIAANQPVAPAKSGTDYLRSKQQQAQTLQSSSKISRELLEGLVEDWKDRPTEQGLRCYALVKRTNVDSVREKLKAADFGGSATVRASGPWPATEFLHE
jgi:hypothetical protein